MPILNNETGNPNLRISLDQTEEVVCKACTNNTFTEAMFLRRASALVTGQPKDTYVPIPTFICTKCQNVNEEFIPEQLKSKIVT